MEQRKINLGSGRRKLDGYINIDNRAELEPDIVCDVIKGLPYCENELDEVRAFDFLEHIPIGKTIQVIEEIHRVLKPGGMFEHSTPSTDGRGAFQDPTHVSFWNINSWTYYTNIDWGGLYGIKAIFGIIRLEDIISDIDNSVIYTRGLMYAVKGGTA